MKKFHTIDWSQRFPLLQSLKDERFKYFGERLIYQNQPESLPKKDFDRIHIETAKRLLSLEEESFTTIPMAEQLIDNIRAEKDISSEKLEYMNEINEMIKEMRIKYEKAIA